MGWSHLHTQKIYILLFEEITVLQKPSRIYSRTFQLISGAVLCRELLISLGVSIQNNINK